MMMYHLLLLVLLVVLLAGMWGIFTSIQIARLKRLAAGWPLVGFFTCFNLVILVNIISVYTHINLLRDSDRYMTAFFPHILGAMAGLGFIGMAVTLLLIDLAFRGSGYTRRTYLSIGVPVAILVILCLAIPIRFLLGADMGAITVHYLVLSFLLTLIIIVLLIDLLNFGRKVPEGMDRRRILVFGFFYLVTFVILFLMRPSQEWIRLVLISCFMLLFNLFPIYWLKKFVPSGSSIASGTIDDPALLDAFCREHRISNREREIAELILQGMSNKEIEDNLFISINTVKNHIYRLFQKLGINSRSQFIRMLLEEQKSRNST